jgi:hypothetical protein
MIFGEIPLQLADTRHREFMYKKMNLIQLGKEIDLTINDTIVPVTLLKIIQAGLETIQKEKLHLFKF